MTRDDYFVIAYRILAYPLKGSLVRYDYTFMVR